MVNDRPQGRVCWEGRWFATKVRGPLCCFRRPLTLNARDDVDQPATRKVMKGAGGFWALAAEVRP